VPSAIDPTTGLGWPSPAGVGRKPGGRALGRQQPGSPVPAAFTTRVLGLEFDCGGNAAGRAQPAVWSNLSAICVASSRGCLTPWTLLWRGVRRGWRAGNSKTDRPGQVKRWSRWSAGNEPAARPCRLFRRSNLRRLDRDGAGLRNGDSRPWRFRTAGGRAWRARRATSDPRRSRPGGDDR
jgi:hypothetical protein